MDEKKKNKGNKEQQTQNVENVENVENSTEQELINENQSVIAENEQLKKQVEEFKDKWMRNVAEFDNYKKRNAKLWQEAFADGEKEAVLKIIPIGDNLDRAVGMGLDAKTEEGIINLKRQFNDALKSLGVEEIDPTGQPFDPNIAEAVMQVVGEEGEQSDTVKQTFEKGYKLNEKIIKYAKVSVIK